MGEVNTFKSGSSESYGDVGSDLEKLDGQG
jgi:hypothetical protein